MIRALLCLLLAMTLATTSVHAAVMHSEMQGAYQMAICADSVSGQTTLSFDATGKPIQSGHRCPDCTAALLALLQAAPQIPTAPTHSQTLRPEPTPASATTQPPSQSARDPPLSA